MTSIIFVFFLPRMGFMEFLIFLNIFLLYNIVCVIELTSHSYFVYNQSVPRFWFLFAIWNLFKFSRFIIRGMALSSYDKHIIVLKTDRT